MRPRGPSPATACSSCLWSTSHCSLPPTLGAGADEHEAAAELLAVQLGVQLTGVDGGERVVGAVRLPRAPVPDDHVAAAVLARAG